MLYTALREPLFALLRAPTDPPRPPADGSKSVSVFQASPRFLMLKLVIHFSSMALAVAIELVGWALAPPGPGAAAFALVSFMALGATLIAILFRYLLIRVDYDLRYYVLTDRSLRIRRGALSIEESTYTFANVQNLVLQQGPFERLFGLSHLQIDTAGGGATSAEGRESAYHKGRLEGIELDVATELRARILASVSAHSGAGLGDRGDGPRLPSREPSAGAELLLLQAISEKLSQINGIGKV